MSHEMECDICHKELTSTPNPNENGRVSYPFVGLMAQGPVDHKKGEVSMIYQARYCRECFFYMAPKPLYDKLFPYENSWISKTSSQ